VFLYPSFLLVLWDVFGENKNYNVLTGHKNAVLEVKWFNPSSILSCSADKTVAIWDSNKGSRVRKLTEHSGIVNSCCVAKNDETIIGSGSDDCTAILWDSRSKYSVSTIYHDYQICSVALSNDGTSFFTAGIDNLIR
jgi:Prp8 binding protein